MIKKLNALLVTTIIAGAVLALTTLNRETTTLEVLPGVTFTASLGVISIGLLLVGIVAGSIIALFYGIKSYFSTTRFLKKDREEKDHVALFLTARAALAAKEFNKARSILEKLAKYKNFQLLANLELSRVIQQQGDIEAAVHLTDELRKSYPDEFEVLLRSSEVHEACGNKTAALDALSLMLDKFNSIFIAGRARDLALALQRYDDALTYQEKGASYTKGAHSLKAEILYQIITRDNADTPDTLESALRSHYKQFPQCIPTIEHLAQIERKKGNTEKAAALLLKKAELTHRSTDWNDVRLLWLAHGSPERALSAATTALRQVAPEHTLEVELSRIRLLIELGMIEEAQKALSQVQLQGDPQQRHIHEQSIRLLKLATTLPGGAARDELLNILDGKKESTQGQDNASMSKMSKEPPPARLSTP